MNHIVSVLSVNRIYYLTFTANESTNGAEVTGVHSHVLTESAFKHYIYEDFYTCRCSSGVMDSGVKQADSEVRPFQLGHKSDVPVLMQPSQNLI